MNSHSNGAGSRRSIPILVVGVWLWFGSIAGFAQEWPADRAPDELKIATWNLEWFFDDIKENNRSDEIGRAHV